MPRKSAPKHAYKLDDPEQSKRFMETAREIGADESGREFRKALKRVSSGQSKIAKVKAP
jgi:hypothetical protein